MNSYDVNDNGERDKERSREERRDALQMKENADSLQYIKIKMFSLKNIVLSVF